MPQLFSRPDLYIGRCGGLRCRVVEIDVPEAPPFLRGLRALFVTDLHVLPSTGEAELSDFAGRVRALDPELILLGGDYADGAEDCERLFRALAPLDAPLGCYGVPGNNDREAWPRLRRLRRVMEAAGARLLVNQAVCLPYHGGRLYIAGLDEYLYGRPRYEGLLPEKADPGQYRILLSHFAVPVSPMPELMLCGHTHGGQFNLLGVSPYTVGFERTPRRGAPSQFIHGLREFRGGRMLVSKGIGASRVQWRIGVRPEMHLITFR